MESVLGRDEAEPHGPLKYPHPQLLWKVLKRADRETQGRLQQYRCQELREKPSEWQGDQEVPQDESVKEMPSLSSGSKSGSQRSSFRILQDLHPQLACASQA